MRIPRKSPLGEGEDSDSEFELPCQVKFKECFGQPIIFLTALLAKLTKLLQKVVRQPPGILNRQS